MLTLRYPGFGREMLSMMRDFSKMQREMESFLDSFSGSGVFPAVNVSEDAENIYLTAEIPGIRPEEIDISVVGRTLTIRGERRIEEASNVGYHRRERSGGLFRKALTLPYDVDADKVIAACEDGVLKLTLPKADEVKPKKIEVIAA